MEPKDFLENVNILDNEALIKAMDRYAVHKVAASDKYFLDILNFISDVLNFDPPNLQAAKDIAKEVLETNQIF